ncbi:MAG TPA: ATP-dependent RNA helicase HrpA [Rudaea sp.]|nr:ATP-dependent RNA helicase HrpA [Rudaea sp.]
MAALRGTLDKTLLSDRRALSRALQNLDSAGTDSNALDEWRRKLARAQEKFAARAALVPEIRVDESLPIAAKADEIVQMIRKHQVIVLAGETGSGKSTQLPKLCLAAGRGVAGLIGCTQPRRVAARSVARRVASELETQVGGLVGYQVRFTESVGERTLIKFMTDGILLAETQSDEWLNRYDTIILDEAHERSLNIDFLLGYLKRLLVRRRDLKLIVTSATIDTATFARHFDDAPVIEVEGRSYPVDVRWRPPADRDDSTTTERVVAAIDDITAEDARGDALIFLPGEREIRDAHLALSRRKYRATEVLPLYARLSAAEQDRVFKPGPQRRIVLATNVAETSLTVPRIRYVVDTGTARVKRYMPRSQLERLHVEPISQAAADQRKGRCGRIGPGICIRLYAEDDFASRPRYSDPEILRSSLAGVILRMLSLKLGDVEKFPFVEAPSSRAIGDGYRRLIELGAIDEDAPVPSSISAGNQKAAIRGRTSQKRLTAVGRDMSKLPIDVALSRMLIEAKRLNATRELLVLTAFLSIQDPRERPADARQAADQAHAPFVDPKSDFVSVLNLWHAHSLAHEELTQSKLRDWCSARFLSYLRMREWRELHRQLLVITDELGWRVTPAPPTASGERAGARGQGRNLPERLRRTEVSPPHPTLSPDAVGGEGLPRDGEVGFDFEAIHRCLLSGWPTQVGIKDERSQFRGTRERKFQIFPGSALAKSPPQWILAGQIIDLQKVYGLLCARIEPEWIEQQAAHLVKRTWRDPHWSRKRGAVVAFEQVTLFGLTIVEKRVVQFGAQDAAVAHDVFIREALVRGDIDSRTDVVRANARVLAQAQELEAKRRRAGLIKDEAELAEFFVGKLPDDISTAAAFDAWYRRAGSAEQAALHWSLDFVLANEPGIRASDFPAAMEFAGHKLKLDYRFIPGDAADGVTLHIPLAFVNAVSALRCEWLVPGLLAEKVAELIRGLPKSLRRNFVPAPDFARAFAAAETPREEHLLLVLAAYLQRVTGVEVSARDFDGIAVPAHLQMRFRVYDEHGATLSESRDLETIRAQWSDSARAAFSRHADAELTREDVDAFDFDEIPKTLVSEGGLIAFPALVDLGESVALRVFERVDEAQTAHRAGVVRLLRRALREAIKQARRQLPIARNLALKYTAIATVDDLREDIVDAAFGQLIEAMPLDIRRREDFQHAVSELGRNLFGEAMRWLVIVEDVLVAYAELTPWLEAPLMGYARANYEDLREQLDALIHPGFVREIPRERLAQFPRYLKAMRLRAERLRQDATRDQARMLTVRGYWRDYLKLKAERGEDDALSELRWLIEEMRVSLFAQELKTAETVSPKRLGKLIETLRTAR